MTWQDIRPKAVSLPSHLNMAASQVRDTCGGFVTP